MKKVIIYTDGACSGNPGPGGWGAVLIYGEARRELSGYDPATTNNRMELTAAIRSLEALKTPCEVDLYSDSAYLVNAHIQGWIHSWIRNGWKKADKSKVENEDLWKKLNELTGIHKVNFIKVKGHSDNKENTRCDQLATGEIKKHRM